MKKVKPNLAERALNVLAPKTAGRIYEKRAKKAWEKTGERKPGPQMRATGYGNNGASLTKNSVLGWIPGGGSAEDDIDLHGALLRARARDLYAGGGLARSGVNTLTTSTVGWGIHPKPQVDKAALGLSDEEADEWEKKTLREFRLWAENNMCDYERQQNFYGLQELAFRNMLISGDDFALLGMKPNKRTPYMTTVHLVEADRVSTEGSMGGDSDVKTLDNGNRVIDGVEIDKDGAVAAYWFTNRHPLSEENEEEVKWERVEAVGETTGYPNVLHIMTQERPEQRRGIPFVSAQMIQIKQLDRYIDAELAGNLVRAMLTAFIKSDVDNAQLNLEDVIPGEEKVTSSDLQYELGPGVIYELPPGKDITAINPLGSNTGFENFVAALETIIGSSMEIPKEVLTKKYESNYTAARGALLDFWRTVRVYRTRFNWAFNQPIYEEWLSEAVSIGRIEAPGFFEDPAIRQAWCGCMWMGASMGHVDPLKEVNAARERVALHVSTEEQEAAEYNGNDWTANIAQRKKEIEAGREMGEEAGQGLVLTTDEGEEDEDGKN